VGIWLPDAVPLLTGAHNRLVRADWPAEVDLAPLESRELSAAERESAIAGWTGRMNGEYVAAAHFSQLASALLVAGVPIEVSACVSRIVGDELRHAELCARVVRHLGGDPAFRWEESPLLDFSGAEPLRAIFRHILGLACLSETVSLAILDRNLAAAEEPVAEVLRRIRADEAFHAEAGWAVAALVASWLPEGTVAAEIPRAQQALDDEFSLPIPADARTTTALLRLGSIAAEAYAAVVDGAKASAIARLATLPGAQAAQGAHAAQGAQIAQGAEPVRASTA
jgi:hypothetical protein